MLTNFRVKEIKMLGVKQTKPTNKQTNEGAAQWMDETYYEQIFLGKN